MLFLSCFLLFCLLLVFSSFACSFPLLGSFFPFLWSCSLWSSDASRSDIQTLPRVYFFDSYATLQTNGADSRFLYLLTILPPATVVCWLPSFCCLLLLFLPFSPLFSWYFCGSVVLYHVVFVLLCCSLISLSPRFWPSVKVPWLCGDTFLHW